MKFKIIGSMIAILMIAGCEKHQSIPPEMKQLMDEHGGASSWYECNEGFLVEHRINDYSTGWYHNAAIVVNDADVPTRCGEADIKVKESVATGALSGSV
jgi:hypothetical protein